MPVLAQAPTSSVVEGFNPLTGSNFSLVGDDSDATFVATDTAGTVDRLGFPDLPGTATGVNSVSFVWRHSSLSGDHTARIKLFLGADVTNGTTRSLSTSVTSTVETALARPGGGSWTVADVNALDAGYELVGGSAFDDARIYRLVRLTDYAVATAAPARDTLDVPFHDTNGRSLDFPANPAPVEFHGDANRVVEYPPTTLEVLTGWAVAPDLELDED